MTVKEDAIRALYAQVSVPAWAAPNLDGLADVLRDLSWLPVGPVGIAVPDLGALPPIEAEALRRVLARAVAETRDSPRPVVLTARPTESDSETGTD